MELTTAGPLATPVPEIGQHHQVQVNCGDMSGSSCATANLLIGLALSGLTGVKASIPIFVVAVGSRLSDSFPLHLAPESAWLQSWPCIICLGVFLILELISDCIPAIDHTVDAIMLALKPIFGTIIAVAPYYGQPGFHVVLLRVLGASGGALLSALMSIAKAVNTLAINACTVGCCSPVRSAVEDVVAVTGSVLTIMVGITVACTVIFLCLTFIVVWVVVRKRKGKPLLPHWCPCRWGEKRQSKPPGALDTSEDESSLSGSESSTVA